MHHVNYVNPQKQKAILKNPSLASHVKKDIFTRPQHRCVNLNQSNLRIVLYLSITLEPVHHASYVSPQKQEDTLKHPSLASHVIKDLYMIPHNRNVH